MDRLASLPPSLEPAGADPSGPGRAPDRSAPPRAPRRYRARHDAAVVLAEIRRLQGASRARGARLPQAS